ncbi:CPBP family intramembrane glutamic endopeptidase [Pantoea sp. SOD02]|uniref:CPBP family intramembrane glutamic endopeptidase n=1 Tax=Pantoea sp. SOD02 TaxID=2970818 RepID=UPI002158179B|nr:CPBP family intramembrane glutamic endopeptidase [Pantoea sp. SOD02]UVC29432.1 CPBP family glutamic-type intramembrane protease [Pantoea sp. SOD02]
METRTKKEGWLNLSLFLLMFLLTAFPLLFPNRIELIESGLFLPYGFMIEFFVIVPIYLLKFRKKEGFGIGNFTVMQFLIFFSLILIIQFIIPKVFFHTDDIVSQQAVSLPLYTLVLTQISYILMVPVYEEIAIRGGLFGALTVFSNSKVFSAIITSLIFSLLHTQYSGFKPLFLLYLISLTLVAARVLSKGLLLPVLLHTFMNGIVINGHYLFNH